jgi:hypothetical protein
MTGFDIVTTAIIDSRQEIVNQHGDWAFVYQFLTTKETRCYEFVEENGPVRFEVLTAASMKMAVFWVVAPRNLVEVYRRFRGTCCLHHHGDALTVRCATDSLPVKFVKTSNFV